MIQLIPSNDNVCGFLILYHTYGSNELYYVDKGCLHFLPSTTMFRMMKPKSRMYSSGQNSEYYAPLPTTILILTHFDKITEVTEPPAWTKSDSPFPKKS